MVGDVLLDRDVAGRVERLSPDAPVPVVEEDRSVARPGGAGLAASLALDDGVEVSLVTALADDESGRELAGLLARRGLAVAALPLEGATPEKLRVRAGDQLVVRIDRGGDPGLIGAPTAAALDALAAADAVLVSDYGRGLSSQPELRRALAELAGRVPIVWDPHPDGAEPVAGVAVVTPNEPEARRLAPGDRKPGVGALADLAAELALRWRAEFVCVTRGADGALLAGREITPRAIPARPASGDPCGAGDRFAACLTARLATGTELVDAVADAVESASAFVAGRTHEGLGGPAGTPSRRREDVPASLDAAIAVCERVRTDGGTVVATGGCFDLLHAGHIRTLEAARRLGDCLVVCLNSDRSVRRLKGSDRPLVPESERAAVLAALACVDAVVSFDEETPVCVLERLRPAVWAKGGDYADSELPEADAVARWGGRVVLLPFVEGRSTTRLIEEASRAG